MNNKKLKEQWNYWYHRDDKTDEECKESTKNLLRIQKMLKAERIDCRGSFPDIKGKK